ncbi:MAG TPA: dockerin type I repeat-containing protein [Clostridia bacterium]
MAAAAVLLTAMPVTFASAQERIVYGDVNEDGNVNSRDYSLMSRYIIEGSAAPEPEWKTAGDLNADGLIDRNDMNLLKDYLLKNIREFPSFEIRMLPDTEKIEKIKFSYETILQASQYEIVDKGNIKQFIEACKKLAVYNIMPRKFIKEDPCVCVSVEFTLPDQPSYFSVVNIRQSLAEEALKNILDSSEVQKQNAPLPVPPQYNVGFSSGVVPGNIDKTFEYFNIMPMTRSFGLTFTSTEPEKMGLELAEKVFGKDCKVRFKAKIEKNGYVLLSYEWGFPGENYGHVYGVLICPDYKIYYSHCG